MVELLASLLPHGLVRSIFLASLVTVAITLLIFFSSGLSTRFSLQRLAVVEEQADHLHAKDDHDELFQQVPDSRFNLQQSDLEQLRTCLDPNPPNSTHCPSYFAWIRHDLSPWKSTGITEQTIQSARPKADFRVVIVNGSLYTERYNKCFQSRDDFTLWGMLMLLQSYPGQVPDVDLMFNCGDWPLVFRSEHQPDNNATTWPPPPLFIYCSTRSDHFDIVFPDWSYWGWPETNIVPWEIQREDIISGAAETGWGDREPIAHWKGNYDMGPARADLVKCTVNNTNNYSLVTYHQDWRFEEDNHFKNSNLSQQCKHRYKVYVQGGGWSVSFKYILSCGSTVLQIEPMFQEFFARALMPFVHFWPVNRLDICNTIKFAVDWGNDHPKLAEAIGKCGQRFLQKEVTMDYVYQYMLHMLREYGKLLKFKPVPLPGVEPMSLDSVLPGHELTMPRQSSNGRRDVCLLREDVSADTLLVKQAEGYQRIKLDKN